MKQVNPAEFTCPSWLSGKLSNDIEINTSLSYVSIYDFYAQGDDAVNIIDEINYIFNTQECTALEAAEKWANNML
jgi:hypothetical protein